MRIIVFSRSDTRGDQTDRVQFKVYYRHHANSKISQIEHVQKENNMIYKL